MHATMDTTHPSGSIPSKNLAQVDVKGSFMDCPYYTKFTPEFSTVGNAQHDEEFGDYEEEEDEEGDEEQEDEHEEPYFVKCFRTNSLPVCCVNIFVYFSMPGMIVEREKNGLGEYFIYYLVAVVVWTLLNLRAFCR